MDIHFENIYSDLIAISSSIKGLNKLVLNLDLIWGFWWKKIIRFENIGKI